MKFIFEIEYSFGFGRDTHLIIGTFDDVVAWWKEQCETHKYTSSIGDAEVCRSYCLRKIEMLGAAPEGSDK